MSRETPAAPPETVGTLPERGWLHRVPRLRRPQENGPAPAPVALDDMIRDVAVFSGHFLLIVAAVYVTWRMLDSIGLVTITLTVATMISALLRPMVNVLVRRGLPRWVSAVLVFLFGVAAIGVAGWFVISQVTNSVETITAQLSRASSEISYWLVNGPLRLSADQVQQLTADIGRQLTASQGTVVSGAYATATSALYVLSGAILCLFILLFVLLDDGSIWRWVVSLFPRSSHARVKRGGEVAWRTLVAYMRSTVLLAFINALTMVPIMMIGRIELVVPLGVLLFLGSLIPMIGMIVAGAVLVLIALVMNGPVTALVMGIALFLTVQLEGNLLNPYILGKAVNIHPLAILATVTAGTLLGGIFGAFVAVPFVAVVNNVIGVLRPRMDSPTPLVEEGELQDPSP